MLRGGATLDPPSVKGKVINPSCLLPCLLHVPILSRPILPLGSKLPDHCLLACPISLQALLSLTAYSRPEPSPATSFLCSALLVLPYLFPTVFPWQFTQLPQLWKPASRGRGQHEEALRKGRPCQIRE